MVYENREENPFTPSFGEVPLVMAGRSRIVAEFNRAFSSSARRPSLTSLVSGARGTGKTALLTLIEEHAAQRGWIPVNLVALPGLLEDAYEQTARKARHLVDATDKGQLASLTIGPVGLGVSHTPRHEKNWRTKMSELLDELSRHETGLLFTIDEINPELDELIEFVSVYQLFVREGRKVALIMAGLPHNTSLLLLDKSVSFLRRAQLFKLERIPDFEIRKALESTFAQSERSVSDTALDRVVEAIEGFPFMMQLVGFRVWEEGTEPGLITDAQVQEGIRHAQEEMKSRVLLSSYQELSGMDRRFLHAVAQAPGPCSVPEIAKRLGKTNSYATQYKNRLLEQGLIEVSLDGKVRFSLPMLREFLEENPPGM